MKKTVHRHLDRSLIELILDGHPWPSPRAVVETAILAVLSRSRSVRLPTGQDGLARSAYHPLLSPLGHVGGITALSGQRKRIPGVVDPSSKVAQREPLLEPQGNRMTFPRHS